METYICIGKCVPTPASLSRAFPLALSSGPDLFHSPCVPPPLISAPRARSAPVLRHPSRSYPLVSLVPSRSSVSTPARSLSPRFSLDPSLSFSHPLFPARSRYPAFSIGVPPRSVRWLFFSAVPPFFPQHAPGPSSDFYNLLLVARHTPPTVASSAAAAAVAVCPARPTRKNRKIEENKSDRRATARRASRGVYSGGGGGSGNGNGGGSYGGGR